MASSVASVASVASSSGLGTVGAKSPPSRSSSSRTLLSRDGRTSPQPTPPGSASTSNPRRLSRQATVSRLQLQLPPAVAAALKTKQQNTQTALQLLDEMSRRAPDPFVQTVLRELRAVFINAIYDKQPISQPSFRSPTALNARAKTPMTPSPTTVTAANPIQPGKEFFSLIQTQQNQLEYMVQYQLQVDTKLSLELAIKQELTHTLDALREDLRQVRQKHLVHHELLQSERAQVDELERDFEFLTGQEEDKKKECEHLQQQLDKLQQVYEDLVAKSTYLDFASKLPLKRHLEDKKLREQEEALKESEEQQHATSLRLEQEKLALDAKYAALEDQVVTDQNRVNELVQEIQVLETQKQALLERLSVMKPCYTPRPDWDAIIKQTPELSSQKFGWELIETRRRSTEEDGSGMMAMRAAEEDEEIDRDESGRMVHGSTGMAVFPEENESKSKSKRRSKAKGGKRRSQQQLPHMSLLQDRESDPASQLASEAHFQQMMMPTHARMPYASNKRGRTSRLIKDMLHWIERLQKHCGVNMNLSNIWHDVEEARLELSMLHQQLDRAVKKHNRIQQVSTPQKNREYLIALGNGEDVPKFLRHHGKIRLRNLKKPEVEVIVRRIWLEKKRLRERSGLHLSVEEALYERLHQQYGFQPLIAEWGYNILLALNSYVWDSEIEMFLLCLTGAISDEVHDDQEEMVVCCHNLLLTLCESYGDPTFVDDKKVLLKDAMVTLRKFFPLKTSVQLQAIEKAIVRDMHKQLRNGPATTLLLDAILPYTKCDSGTYVYSRGFFVKTIRTQHFREIQDYYEALINELEENDFGRTGKLSLATIKEAMLEIDPLADPNVVLNNIAHAMGLRSRTQLDLSQEVEFYAFVRTMNKHLLKFSLNYDPNAGIAQQKDGSPRKSSTITVNGSGTNPAAGVPGVRKGSISARLDLSVNATNVGVPSNNNGGISPSRTNDTLQLQMSPIVSKVAPLPSKRA